MSSLSPMDGIGAMVIQNLDSLWFFSNVMVSINPQTPSPSTTIPDQKHNNKITICIHNNNNPIISNSPNSTPKTPTNSDEQQPNHEIPPSPSPPPTTTTAFETRHEGRSTPTKRKQRSKKQGWNRIREIRREIKSHNDDERKEENDDGVVEICSYKDDDAMKKHLRSWAVVVAYTAVHSNNPFMVTACS